MAQFIDDFDGGRTVRPFSFNFSGLRADAVSDKRKALVERHRRAVTEFLSTIKMSDLIRWNNKIADIIFELKLEEAAEKREVAIDYPPNYQI